MFATVKKGEEVKNGGVENEKFGRSGNAIRQRWSIQENIKAEVLKSIKQIMSLLSY